MRAAILGSPVAHSLSPVLHGAAYAALGLDGWTYERVECSGEELAGRLATFGPDWTGVSVTMPGKHAALAAAAFSTARARHLGVANTLVRRSDGSWAADCTDVDGVAGALHSAGFAPWHDDGPGPGDDAVVLGAGGTAPAAVAALSGLGVRGVTLVVRDPERARGTVEVARIHGLRARVTTFDAAGPLAAGAMVNTTPAGAVDEDRASALVAALPAGAVVLDAVYHPWPTPLAAAATGRGLAVASGLDMLLHQAFGQVAQFTGRPAPRAAMHAALVEATGEPVRPPR